MVHLDVNKTLIMCDPAAGVGAPHLVNSMLASSAFGTVSRDAAGVPTWNLLQPPMLSTQSAPDTMSYDTYLRCVLNPFIAVPDDASPDARTHARTYNLRQREKSKALVSVFTDAGAPGAPFAPVHAALMAAMRLPVGMPPAGFPPFASGMHYLLPAYFVLQRWLAAGRAPYLVVLRTFGSDIPNVIREHNWWLSGTHPAAPPPPPGAASLRMRCPHDLGVATRCGPASRDTRLAVVALDAALTREAVLARALSAPPPPDFAVAPNVPTAADDVTTLSFVVGYRDIAAWLRSRTPRAPHTGAMAALRDDWEWWFSHNETAAAGKLLPLDPADTRAHHVFLDDNIGAACDTRRLLPPHVLAAAGLDAAMFGERVDAATAAAAATASVDAGIVDARDVHTSRPLPFAATRDIHLARVDPISAILNPHYFIDLVSDMHAAWRAAHGLPPPPPVAAAATH